MQRRFSLPSAGRFATATITSARGAPNRLAVLIIDNERLSAAGRSGCVQDSHAYFSLFYLETALSRAVIVGCEVLRIRHESVSESAQRPLWIGDATVSDPNHPGQNRCNI